MTHPWLEAPLAALAERLAGDNLPHALLVTGPPGIGKRVFATAFAAMLLCESRTPRHLPCGQCAGCELVRAGTHPDLSLVTPEEDSSTLKVDQIRALGEALVLSSHRGGWKVAVLAPAEAMNVNAANSLLKTLEEPSDNTVLVLVCAEPARLPATVRSRCQQIRLQVPDPALARDWLTGQLAGVDTGVYLQLAGGAPLAALQLAEGQVLEARRSAFEALLGVLEGRTDPLAVAADWSKDENLQPVYWLRDWLMDLLRIRLTGDTGSVRSADLREALARVASRLDAHALFRQLDHINSGLRVADGVLNRQLLAEDILLAWAARQ
jgi:DNA polymerase-3 subunit delta'